MFTTWFQHPDISLPVVRRRAGEALLESLQWFGSFACSPMIFLRNDTFPSRHAYHAAVRRLEQKGLATWRTRGGLEPVLCLTEQGEARLDPSARPHAWWNRTWNGNWYLLAYDVPESSRPYRRTLRAFLRRLRLGCLQKSVWVTPNDIRPDFDDLCKAAGLSSFAFLFQAKTVLGLSPEVVVGQSWDLQALRDRHAWFIRSASQCETDLAKEDVGAGDAVALSRTVADAYRSVMADDPLLPRSLWPDDYLGEKVFDLHERVQQTISRHAAKR
jgi:phenylacetic acid degradation operon negative regulatory protein